MELQGKHLCGKNIFCVRKKNKIMMYWQKCKQFEKKRVGELHLNQDNSIINVILHGKRFAKNMIAFLLINKHFDFFNLKKFPIDYFMVDSLKEKLHPNKILELAIKLNSLKLANYAIEREADLNYDTFIESAKHSNFVLQIHLKNNVSYPEEGMLAALDIKNMTNIKILSKKIKSVEKYIELISVKEKYSKIKDLLIKELTLRHQKRI